MLVQSKSSNRRIAQVLLISAFIVSSPRFVGLFAAVIGIDLVEAWPFFATLEIGSGLPAALLEGGVLAYLSNTWKNLLNKDYPKNIYWYSLLVGQIVMLVMIPAVITPYLVAVQLHQSVYEILPMSVLWIWTFAVAALNPVMAVAVGLIDDNGSDETNTSDNNDRFSKKAITSALLIDNPTLSPTDLASEMDIPVEEAGELLAEVYNNKPVNYKSNGK